MRALVVVLAALLPSTVLAQHEEHQHQHETAGLFGPYPMTREASGTSWQPDSTPMWGYQFAKGPWTLMVHGTADAVYDDQGGPRGEADFYAPTMGMLMAQRRAGRGTLGLRGMISFDPALLGSSGGLDGWWVGLELLHTLFMREHNAVCDALHAAYPSWDDDQVFDKARLVVAALIAITSWPALSRRASTV